MISLVLAATAAFTGGCSTPWNPGPRPEGSGTLEVRVTGVGSTDGQMLVNVFLGPDGFPADPSRAFAALVLPAAEGEVLATIENVPAGPVAVTAFHDVDRDKELDTDWLGIPDEMWGVSRDAEGFMGPPDYADAMLELSDGQTLQVEVVLR